MKLFVPRTSKVAPMMPFWIGADVRCTDGSCGRVSRIIVNPDAGKVTHLAVDPTHHRGPGRLVPVDLVNAATGQLRLRCTLAEFQTFRPAQDVESVPDLDPTGHENAPAQVNWASLTRMTRDPRKSQAPPQVTVDYVPSGEVDIRRGLTVLATDGEMGQAHGLAVEPGGHQITHVLLQQGRMRRRKEVAIPIDVVTKIGTQYLRLSLTKHQVKDLPPVRASWT